MTCTEAEFVATDSTALFHRTWIPTEGTALRGVLAIVHGLGEHGGRYGAIAEAANAAGFAVVACDHRGHGRSGGLRGHVDSFDNYVADLVGFLGDAVPGLGDDLPVFLLGHSMGGLIAVLTLQSDHGLPLRGAVLSNPCLGVAVQAPKIKVAMAKALAKLLPRLRLDNELVTEDLCRDQAVIDAYVADPHVHRKISTRWYAALLEAMAGANANPDAIQLPTLWLLSGKDAMCDATVATDFAGQLPSPAVSMQRFPEAYHEAHNGPDKGEFVAALLGWLDVHVQLGTSPAAGDSAPGPTSDRAPQPA